MSVPEQKEVHPNAIRAIRLSKGISQQALADLVGTSQSQIDRLERGARRLTVEWLGKIAHALGVRGTELFDWDDSFSLDERFALPTIQRVKGGVSFNLGVPVDNPTLVPLFPTVPHSVRAEMFVIPDVVIGSVKRPVGISPDADVFAFHNPSSAMEERWRIGELVFAARNLSPSPQGPSLLMFGPNSEHGERAALFCRSVIGPHPDLAGRDKANTQIYSYFNALSIGTKDLGGNIFPIETVAARYMVYDWPQLIAV